MNKKGINLSNSIGTSFRDLSNNENNIDNSKRFEKERKEYFDNRNSKNEK